MWTPGRDDQELPEISRMVAQDPLQPCRLLGDGRGQRQPEVDHPGVGSVLAEDQLPEVAVIGDEDPSLPLGDGQDVCIRQCGGVVTGDGGHVVPVCSEEGGQAKLGAFIKELDFQRGDRPKMYVRRGTRVFSA